MAYSAYDELLQRRLLERGGAAGMGGGAPAPGPININPAGGATARPPMPSGIGGLLGRLFNGGGSSGPVGASRAQYMPEDGQPPQEGSSGPFGMGGFGDKLMDFSMGAAFGRNPNESIQLGMQGLFQGAMTRKQQKAAQAELNRTRQVAISMGIPEDIAMNAPPEILTSVIKEAYAAGLKPITLGKGQKAFDAKGGQIADNPDTIATDKPIYDAATGQWITPPGYVPGQSGDRAVKEKILLSPDGKKQMMFDLNNPDEKKAAAKYLELGWVDPSALRNEGEGREFTQENLLRTAYLKQAEPFASLAQNYRRITAASQDTTGASDIAMVYSFMKMLDPTSVVREGEFATAENAGGVDSKITTLYNKLLSGERLSPQVRGEFIQQSKRQMAQQWQSYDALRKQWEGIVGQYNLDPNRVLPDVSYGLERPVFEEKKTEGENAPAPNAGITPEEAAAELARRKAAAGAQ